MLIIIIGVVINYFVLFVHIHNDAVISISCCCYQSLACSFVRENDERIIVDGTHEVLKAFTQEQMKIHFRRKHIFSQKFKNYKK